ncbi:penicillin-binding transpeptidase domain-containing protein [Actinacidiphila epipremni]|uniref:Penicillin-binding protein n=1 Tax=Actinacidiphila epipremni TaxID=2053013 RepID=A0ABX0ZV98_9ACTN|nr:penicillin-binding transpeptidase domain-containing protein [Actinacidiphila epipremni]NJP46209.1 penicillin-binding protein [Actinacidiphila epipremni]
MARGVKFGIVGTVLAVMVGVAGYGAYNIYDSLDGGSGGGGSGTTASTADVNKPVEADDITDTAKAFLAAWSSGDIGKAALQTDSVQTATSAMTSLRTDGAVSKVVATPLPISGTTVPFSVQATISYQGLPPKEWDYTSSLTVDRNLSGQPVVKWLPGVLEPDLKNGQKIVTGQATSPQLDLVDRHGTVMTADKYPGLTDVFADLRKRYPGAGGTPGIETYVADAADDTVKTLMVLKPGKNAQLKTTLDAKIQAAAEKAVRSAGADAGVTAVDTDNGDILAMASSGTGENYALSLKAPGSTFKIVTAAALMMLPPSKDYPNGIRPSSVSQCVSGYAAVGGRPYKNVTPDNTKATLAWDFAKSCNTGFIRLSQYMDQPDAVAKVARKYFGLDGSDNPWYVGTGTPDGSVPGGTGDEFTSEMIGQGQVLMNTLNMASVAATARSGRFHQPSILDDTHLIDNRTTIPTTPLPSAVHLNLMAMMHQTVTNGTATGVLTGVASPYGAKTGSAEENEGQPNGWFTAYADHVAAAGMVVSGGHGNASAGPIVDQVLRAAS